MKRWQFSDQSGAQPVLQSIDAAARRRVSGPGLRTFLAIAECYGIPTNDRIALLGEPSNSTHLEWVKNARGDLALTLLLDTLMRISRLLGIHESPGILFPVEAMTWLKGSQGGELSTIPRLTSRPRA